MDGPDRVEPVVDVAFGGLVAASLLGDRVDDDRAAVVPGQRQGLDQVVEVVPVDRADVLQAEGVEDARVDEDVLHALLDRVERAVGHASRGARVPERALRPVEEGLVALRQPDRVEAADGVEFADEPSHGRGVGAVVVVDDDDEGAVGVLRDVVEGLPGHPARHRAVSDDGDGAAARLAGELESPRDPVGPREGGGRVGVLDDVVGRLRARGIARQPAFPAERGEIVASGEDLVDVGLVAGVEEDGVRRGVEDAVQRDGQLDHAEVGAQVAARLRHVLDEEGPDFLGQLRQPRPGERLEVLRSSDPVDQAHPITSSRSASSYRVGASPRQSGGCAKARPRAGGPGRRPAGGLAAREGDAGDRAGFPGASDSSEGGQPGMASRTMFSPSAIVGWAMTASRTRCQVRPPSMAIWTDATTSLAPSPMTAAPRIRSVSASTTTL